MDEHGWARDPEQCGEGLVCWNCGITEAEAAHSPDGSRCHAGPVAAQARARFADLAELADDPDWLGI